MNENTLGKNIKYLREMHGENQDELAYVLDVTKSAISDYEHGRRRPKRDKIEKIASYYKKTVDELLGSKLYELDALDSERLVDYRVLVEYCFRILPLIDSEKASKNILFSKGIKIVKEMLETLSKGESVNGMIIGEAIDCFVEASKEEVYEAYANTLWCYFFIWSQQYTDLKAMQNFQSRLISHKVDWKEMIYETRKIEKKVFEKKDAFVKDCDEIITVLIRLLKETEEGAEIGDYYLALRYVLGMVDTGYSNEMNQAVGMQMMMSFAQFGNRYAFDYIKIGNDME